MEFRISNILIAKKKRGLYVGALFVAIVAFLVVLSSNEDEFSWGSFVLVFGITAVFSVGANYASYRSFYKYAQNHKINVSADGLLSYEGDTESLLKWDKVNDIVVKRNNGQVKKLTLKTSLTGKVDLSRYENLNQLYDHVAKFTNNNQDKNDL